MIALLALLSCSAPPVEIEPELDICRVVSSEQTTPVTEVVDLLSLALDTTGAALAPLESTSRWATLRVELMVDEESPSYLLTREATGASASCPTVIRTPVLGSVSLDDGVEMFVVSGWVETTSSSGEHHLDAFRLGGEAHSYPYREEVQEALLELSISTVGELRPEIDLSQVIQILADFYMRGGPEGGELGIRAKIFEPPPGHEYQGPLLSGPWSRVQVD